MGEHSAKAFTTDKLKKFEVSGKNGGSGNGDKAASADDYGRKAARTSDVSAFAFGGGAKAPSLGRAGRAKGGRINRPAVASADFPKSKTGGNYPGKIPDNEGGKARNLSMLTDGGPRSYGDRPLIIGHGDQNALRARGGKVKRARGGRTEISDLRDDKVSLAKGGRIGKQLGGGLGGPPPQTTPPGVLAPPPGGQLPGLPGLGRAKGGRTNLARGGKAKGAKGKTVVNVIVGGDKGQQQPPPPPIMPHPMVPPPPPPPAQTTQQSSSGGSSNSGLGGVVSGLLNTVAGPISGLLGLL